nr:hypothetical protein [Ardenticatenales bacterium]
MMSTDFVDINLLPHPRGVTTVVVEGQPDVRSRLRRLLAIAMLAGLFFGGTVYA